MQRPLSNPWIAGAPTLMSLSVLGLVAWELLRHGLHAPHHDEGTLDHVAILLMFGQIPMLAASLVADWRDLWHRLPVIASQVALWALAFACASLT